MKINRDMHPAPSRPLEETCGDLVKSLKSSFKQFDESNFFVLKIITQTFKDRDKSAALNEAKSLLKAKQEEAKKA
jgi:hypothetical protein